MYQKKEVVTCRCICLVIFVDVDDNDGRCFYEYSFAYVFLSVLLWRRIHARIVLCLIEVIVGALLLFQVFVFFYESLVNIPSYVATIKKSCYYNYFHPLANRLISQKTQFFSYCLSFVKYYTSLFSWKNIQEKSRYNLLCLVEHW